jgi:hypothetical protein
MVHIIRLAISLNGSTRLFSNRIYVFTKKNSPDKLEMAYFHTILILFRSMRKNKTERERRLKNNKKYKKGKVITLATLLFHI